MKLLSLFFLLCLAPFFASADNAIDGPLQMRLVVQKVTRTANQEVLVLAETAAPGDVLQYNFEYVNRTASTLTNVGYVIPIPISAEFTPTAGMSAPEQASLDGLTFEDVPLTRKVMLPYNQEVVVVIEPAEYRFLKWTKAEVSAGETFRFQVRVRVIPTKRLPDVNIQ